MLPIAPSTETRPCLETVCKNDAPRMIHLDATGGEAAEILYSVFPGMELILPGYSRPLLPGGAGRFG